MRARASAFLAAVLFGIQINILFGDHIIVIKKLFYRKHNYIE